MRKTNSLILQSNSTGCNPLCWLEIDIVGQRETHKYDSIANIVAENVTRSLGLYGHDNHNGVLLESKCHENVIHTTERSHNDADGTTQIDVRV